MITVEFRDFDDMVAFAKRLAADITGRHETSEDQKKVESSQRCPEERGTARFGAGGTEYRSGGTSG